MDVTNAVTLLHFSIKIHDGACEGVKCVQSYPKNERIMDSTIYVRSVPRAEAVPAIDRDVLRSSPQFSHVPLYRSNGRWSDSSKPRKLAGVEVQHW
jgi:hypothetical protein